MVNRARQRVDISIMEPFTGLISRAWLRKVAFRALEGAIPGETCQMGLMISDDDTIRLLNKEYRGLDEVTDVLSFSTHHQGHWEGEGEAPATDGDMPFVTPEDEPQHLGEIIISYPQVGRQAGPGASGFKAEVALLVAHGVLHLLGYDHAEPSEEADMKAREQEILSRVSL